MASNPIFSLVFLLPWLLGSFAAAQATPPTGPQVGRVTSGFAPYPEPDSGYVTDGANLLTDMQEERIEHWLWRVEAETGVEIAVVTIGSVSDYPGAAGPSIEAFATGLFNRYGIGNLPEGDGVLLLVARDDRKARIEVGDGYSPMRNRDARLIMDQTIIPHFKQGDYGVGITEGVRAVMLEYAGVRAGLNWRLIVLLVGVPLLGLIAYSLFKSGKRGWGWVVVGLLIVLIIYFFAALHAVSKHGSRRGSWGSSGSSSWSSGGFGGGFGGGSSSGGGATGSW